MENNINMEDKIKTNAELVIKQLGPLSGFEFGYTAESVSWVDQFIEHQRHRSGVDENTIDRLADMLGSFLGECIIRFFGGHWQNINGEWSVYFDNGNVVFPFSKVKKQFINGREDSIESFFEVIPMMVKQNADQSLILESMKQLTFFIRQAEDAYDRIYDARSNSEGTAAYSDCKENMYDAIHLARQLGLEQKAIELEKRLTHFKEVFRHQMS